MVHDTSASHLLEARQMLGGTERDSVSAAVVAVEEKDGGGREQPGF